MRDVAPDARPRRGGIAPYGWRWERGQLVEDRHEQHVRWLILHMHRQGYALARIAGELAALNLFTREGGQCWPRTNLHRIVSTAERLEDTG
jgi:hypothetical protein